MRVYRIANIKHIEDLQGTGGLYAAGRWHRKGRRVLYTSESVALAKLEVLVNAPVKIPKEQALLTLELPADISIKTVSPDDMADHWHHFPYPASLSRITEEWIIKEEYWVMRVPSAQSFTEWNYLLNPLHPQHKELRIVSIEPHEFDPRLKQ